MFGLGKKKTLFAATKILPEFDVDIDMTKINDYSEDEAKTFLRKYHKYFEKVK